MMYVTNYINRIYPQECICIYLTRRLTSNLTLRLTTNFLLWQMRGRPLTSSSDDEESDFRDIPFPQDAAMQQVSDISFLLSKLVLKIIDIKGKTINEDIENLKRNFSENMNIECDLLFIILVKLWITVYHSANFHH